MKIARLVGSMAGGSSCSRRMALGCRSLHGCLPALTTDHTCSVNVKYMNKGPLSGDRGQLQGSWGSEPWRAGLRTLETPWPSPSHPVPRALCRTPTSSPAFPPLALDLTSFYDFCPVRWTRLFPIAAPRAHFFPSERGERFTRPSPGILKPWQGLRLPQAGNAHTVGPSQGF